MKLDWKTKSKRPAHYTADHDGLRYEVRGAARSYTARIYRLNAGGDVRLLIAFDDDRVASCIAWAERFAADRTHSRAAARRVRQRIADLPQRAVCGGRLRGAQSPEANSK